MLSLFDRSKSAGQPDALQTLRDRMNRILLLVSLLAGGVACGAGQAETPAAQTRSNLLGIARTHASVHRFSTLFTAHDVKNHLSKDEAVTAELNGQMLTVAARGWQQQWKK